MLVISYGTAAETLRTFSTMLDEIWIGFDDRCHLRIPADHCEPIHCTLRRDDQKWILTPHAPMLVNGVPIRESVYVAPADAIEIGACTLRLQPAKHEPDEQVLIDGARTDLAGRSVYAD